jgi:hypothetical protein
VYIEGKRKGRGYMNVEKIENCVKRCRRLGDLKKEKKKMKKEKRIY